MKLRYASECGKESTLSIANWRPIPQDKFMEQLHTYSCTTCDELGYDGIKHVSAMRTDRRGTVSIYYIAKGGDHSTSIYTPVLMLMHTKSDVGTGGKILCFEFIPYEETDPR